MTSFQLRTRWRARYIVGRSTQDSLNKHIVPVTTLRKDPELEAFSGQTLRIKESTDLEFAGKL